MVCEKEKKNLQRAIVFSVFSVFGSADFIMTVQQSGRTGVAIDDKIEELEDLKNAFKLKTSKDMDIIKF